MSSPSTRRLGRPRDRSLPSRRREQILDSAARVFAERGYPETDLEVVAARIGLSKGTIYRYFPSKTALFLAAVDNGMRRLLAAVEVSRDDAQDPLQIIARAIRAYLEFFDGEPHFAELLIQERAQFRDRKKHTYFEYRDANLGPWRELIGQSIASGQLRDVPVDRVVSNLGNLMYGTMFTNRIAGRRQTIDQQWRDILDIVFHGILSEAYRGGHPTLVDQLGLDARR